MTSLISEVGLFTVPDLSILGSKVDTISVANGIFTTLTVGSAIVTSISVSGPVTITGATTKQIQDPSLSAKTIGVANATLYSYAMPVGTVNHIMVSVSGITAAGATLAIRGSIRAKNIGGTGGIGTIFDYYFNSDGALSGASMSFAVVGTNLVVTVTGVIGQIIRFSGFATNTQTVYS